MANTEIEVKKGQPTPPAPQDMWGSLRTEMDRLFDRFGGGWHMAPFGRMLGGDLAPRLAGEFNLTVPAVDVKENGAAFKITAELPGMAEKDVEVKVSGDMLTLKGEKRQEREEKDESHHLRERSYGSFERSFRLPPSVDREKISADFSKGVLTVTLPKSTEAQQREKTIEVKSGD